MNTVKVSIYINENDKWKGRPLHVELLQALAKEGIAGATVLRGVAGYTKGKGISTTSLVEAGGLLPLVIEFIDLQANVERMMPLITEMAGARMVATSDVHVRSGGALNAWRD